jgi:hypothetical protein
MQKLIILLAVFLLFVLLWWTRYQVIGGLGEARIPIVVDRFTGKFWLLLPANPKEIKWKSTVSTNELFPPAKEEAKPAGPAPAPERTR